MTTRELADHLARSLLNRPLDCLPEQAIPMSGERTQNDLIALAEFIRSKLSE